MTALLLTIQCLLIAAAAIVGGLAPSLLTLSHRRMQVVLSFVSGVMLGVALLHLLPHAWMEFEARGRDLAEPARFEVVAWWMIGGFLVMFLLERFLCFHHHETAIEKTPGCAPDHVHQHDHSLHWTGAMIGLSVHSILNGMALAAAVSAESAGHEGEGLVLLAGLGTFLVIFLHKPFDGLTIGALMSAGHLSMRSRLMVILTFACTVPLGALLFTLGLNSAGASSHLVTGAVLALSAGMFLCIALSDVLPELQFHQHDRIKLSAALIAGLALAAVIGWFEAQAHGHGGHDHDHDHSHAMVMVDR